VRHGQVHVGKDIRFGLRNVSTTLIHPG
jgi:hypothetical protein